MKHLSKFLPAETLLLLEEKKANIKELLKITFMDLLLKQVIEITTVSKQPSSRRDKVRSYKYVVRSKNFLNYKPLEHEIVYLSPYQKSSSLKVLFQHLIRTGFQNAKSESKYVSAVRRSPNIHFYFTKNIYQIVFGGFSITQEGTDLRNKIKKEITQLEKDFPAIILSDKEKARQILNTIGGNIFLLKNIDFTLLKQIDSEILAEMDKKYKADDGASGCYGCSSWDSGCTGCSTSDSSGCSGCSGCGGCSGD